MIGTKFWKLKSNRFCTTETLKQLRSWKHQVFLELEVQVELKTKGFVNICLRIILKKKKKKELHSKISSLTSSHSFILTEDRRYKFWKE